MNALEEKIENLDSDEVYRAIFEGVFQAFTRVLTKWGKDYESHKDILKAIERGTESAIYTLNFEKEDKA